MPRITGEYGRRAAPAPTEALCQISPFVRSRGREWHGQRGDARCDGDHRRTTPRPGRRPPATTRKEDLIRSTSTTRTAIRKATHTYTTPATRIARTRINQPKVAGRGVTT